MNRASSSKLFTFLLMSTKLFSNMFILAFCPSVLFALKSSCLSKRNTHGETNLGRIHATVSGGLPK